MISLFAAVFVVAVATTPITQAQPPDSAAGSESITLSPALSKPALDAGQTYKNIMTVINNGTTDYSFVVYARPYSVTGEQYDPNYTEVNPQTEAYRWVQFEKTDYELRPGERVQVPYTVNVPEDAAAGGHYAVLFAETQPPKDSGSSVIRKKRVGLLLYMTVSGATKQAGSLKSWEVPTWQTHRPVTSTVRIQNTGNVHFPAMLHVQYDPLLGKGFQANKELLILPGTTRRIPIEWSTAPAFGIFKASGTVDYLSKTDVLPTKYIILLPTALLLVPLVVVLMIIGWILLKRRSLHGRR
jgi:hypothetical protein